MLVMGGGRVAPNPSNEVDIYDPGTNAWTTGSPFRSRLRGAISPPTRTAPTISGCRAVTIVRCPDGLDGSLLLQGGGTPNADGIANADGNGDASATPTGTPSATPTCTAGGTPGPWTQAAPVAIDHYGGFMDSDGTCRV